MSKIKDSIIDVPVNDTDYDYIMKEYEDKDVNEMQEELDAISIAEEMLETDIEDMMVGVEEEEKVEGDTLSFSPEE